MKEPDPDKIIIHKKDKTKRQSAKAFPRGSKYRGVSKNGSKWQVSAKFIWQCLGQVQVLANEKKKFIGKVKSEYHAARIYDKRALLNDGIMAKTNFNYTKR